MSHLLQIGTMLLLTGWVAMSSATNLPVELQKFVEPETKPIWYEVADLDGDGLEDQILVLERVPDNEYDDDGMKVESGRILLLLLRNSDSSLTIHTRSAAAIQDNQCGGACGDCFSGVSSESGRLILYEYGGSGWRWGFEYVFQYDPDENNWFLAEVEMSTGHVGDPGNVKKHRLLAGKDFSPVDISSFDAGTFIPNDGWP